MLTLFAIPKAFRGHTGVIQRNAIGSWARLGRGSRVVLFGDEEGTAVAARESHLDHVPEVARNEFGTPLVSALFHEARKLAARDGLYYIDHASHVLTSRCLRRQPQRPRWAWFEYHWGAWLGRVTRLALEATRPVRHRLGLRASTFRRIRSLVARWSWKGR
jgi:hypothetical protein